MVMEDHADSSHFVGELTATYKKKKTLTFLSIGSNMASVSACINDYRIMIMFPEN